MLTKMAYFMQMGLGSYNMITYDLREFHDFDLGHLGKFKVTGKKVQNYVHSISFLWKIIESSNFKQKLLMTLWCFLIFS